MKYVGVSAPAFSFPTEPKAILRSIDTVSQDAPFRDVSQAVKKTRCRNLSWTFSKGKRSYQVEAKVEVPGVGQYELSPKKKITEKADEQGRSGSSRFKAAKKIKNQLVERSAVPGVGTYDLAGETNPYMEKTFGYRYETMPGLSTNPGPGAYEIDITCIEKSIAKKQELYKRRQILRQERERLPRRKGRNDEPVNDTMYTLPDSLEEVRKKSSKLGTLGLALTARIAETMKGKNKTVGPGPGDYDVVVDILKDSMERGKGFTALGKYKEFKTQGYMTPGPGSYRYRSAITPDKSYSVGKAKKDLSYLLKEMTPGPADYDVNHGHTSKSVSLTKSARKVGSNDKSHFTYVPGPGSYTVRSDKNEGPKYSVRHKSKYDSCTESTNDKTVGPGAYTPSVSYTQPDANAKSFTKSVRPTLKRIKKPTPGVGDYNIDVESISTARSGISFPLANRGLLPEESHEIFPEPGPGAYYLKHTIPQLQKFEQDKMDITGWKITL